MKPVPQMSEINVGSGGSTERTQNQWAFRMLIVYPPATQFPVYTDLAAKSVVAYRLGGTPDTLVVSSDGTLLRHWKGAYSGSNKQEIEEYFAITLPGLPEK